jgi:hypothetical protein
MRLTRIAFLLPLFLAACDIVGTEDVFEVERDRLDRNAELWASTQPAHYSFFLERLCFCGTEVTARVRIVVLNGAVISRTYADGRPVPSQWHELFPPMEGVFQILREALDREAFEFEVQYDPDRGYPRTVAIDYVENAVDEELGLRLTGFSEEG